MRVELEVESDAITPLAVLRLLESEPISLDTGTKAVDKLLRSHDILAPSVSSPLDNESNSRDVRGELVGDVLAPRSSASLAAEPLSSPASTRSEFEPSGNADFPNVPNFPGDSG